MPHKAGGEAEEDWLQHTRKAGAEQTEGDRVGRKRERDSDLKHRACKTVVCQKPRFEIQ